MKARTVAQAISVTIEMPRGLRVGEPINILWRNAGDSHPRVPVYFLVTAPAEVRFDTRPRAAHRIAES